MGHPLNKKNYRNQIFSHLTLNPKIHNNDSKIMKNNQELSIDKDETAPSTLIIGQGAFKRPFTAFSTAQSNKSRF